VHCSMQATLKSFFLSTNAGAPRNSAQAANAPGSSAQDTVERHTAAASYKHAHTKHKKSVGKNLQGVQRATHKSKRSRKKDTNLNDDERDDVVYWYLIQ
jgi:hypothetical protein